MSAGKLIAVIVISIVIAVMLINAMLAASGKRYLGGEGDSAPSYQFVPGTNDDSGLPEECTVGDQSPGCQ